MASRSIAQDRQRAKKKPSRARRAIGIIGWLLVAACGLCFGSLIGYIGYASDGVAMRTISAIVTREATPARAFPGRNSVTILALGADQDRDRRKRITNRSARSDTIMVVKVDFDRMRADAVSIPRDTLVRIPGHGWGKVNAAHALGGVELAAKTVSDLLGEIPIDHVAVIDYVGFQRLIDAIGGVDLYVDKRLKYDDNWGDLHIDLQPGFQHLNGQQAMGFVRYRHTDSDFKRIERQQVFVQALKDKLKSPGVWVRAPDVLNKASKMVASSLTYEQLLALATYVRSLPQDAVQMKTLPVRDGRGTYLTVDKEESKKILRELSFWESYTYSKR